MGTQGVILIFSFKDKKYCEKIITVNIILIKECLNIFNDVNLVGIPFLILYDISNANDMEFLNEQFRKKVNQLDNVYINNQHIDFENSLSEIMLGMDWLCGAMNSV